MNHKILAMFLTTVITLTMFNINMVFAKDIEEINDTTVTSISAVTDSCDISITGNKTEIKAGESIVYEIKATNIKGGGIVIFEATINYNDTIFNCSILEENDGNWTNLTQLLGDTDRVSYIMMQRKGLEASTEDQIIAKIELTAKTDAIEGTYPINFTNMKLTGGNDASFKVNDQSTDINIIKDASDERDNNIQQDLSDENNDSIIKYEEPSNEKDNSEKNTNNIYAQDTSKANGEILPYTGITEICITLIIAIAIISFIFYKKYKKWENI